jgi:D-glycero-D-manno-heptose 1,7-bisphosphate phosphatase
LRSIKLFLKYVSRETYVMKLIILDRDGVINQDSDNYIKSPEEWIPLPGSLEAIARLSRAGYRVIVATNQSGVSRGLFDIETLNRIHEKMHRLTREAGGVIEAIFFCLDSDATSPCRKPNPGMLEDIGRRLKISLRGVPVVGDNLRDIQAAQAVGAKAILVRTGKGECMLNDQKSIEGALVFNELTAVVDFILAQRD